DQNVILVNVPDGALPDLLAEPLLKELRPDPSPVLRGTVSCIGVDYCNLALAETKGVARQVIAHLEQVERSAPVDLAGGTASRYRPRRPVTLHWSGCPAACGNHQAADIGFLGGRARIGGEVVETFDIFVDGRTGADPQPGQKVLEKIPATEVPYVAERLVRAHQRGESLYEAAARIAAERQLEGHPRQTAAAPGEPAAGEPVAEAALSGVA